MVMARNKEMFFAYLYPNTLDLIFLDFNSSTLYKFILKLKSAKIITLKRERKKRKPVTFKINFPEKENYCLFSLVVFVFRKC